jgi:hypothetical protein
VPGVFIRGNSIEVPGLTILNPADDIKYALANEDYRTRPNTWVRGIVIHTTKGIPGGRDRRKQDIRKGVGPNTRRDERLAQMWSLDDRRAGAHLIADHDASWVNTCDLQEHAAFHAGNVNDVTIGIEIYQGSDAELYEAQLLSVVYMLDFLTRTFSIQRQFHWPYKRHAIKRGLRRGTDMVGIYGHRDCSNNRGRGDPGDAIFEMLQNHGYNAFDYEENEDKDEWRPIQRELELLTDGIPGPKTAAALLAEGYSHGLYVSRPGDFLGQGTIND